MKKTIVIHGKHNIDKMSNNNKREKFKNIDDELDIICEQHNNQINMINKLFLSQYCEYENVLLRELKNKLQSYKNQDLKKQCFDDYYFISLNKIIELLVKSKLKCYYCKENVYILYKEVRNNFQWTLDRIDNEQGHNKDNCVISCLKCNIQRKLMDDNKFKFSKQMKIIKKE